MKVYMLPEKSSLGIGRVVDAYRKYLPAHGIEYVADKDKADFIAVHAGETADDQPDIVHNHGLYPTAEVLRDDLFFDYNAAVIQNLRRAKIITVPSEWVADILRRDMLTDPYVLPHGIDLKGWEYKKDHAGYVVWAKGHVDKVCSPEHVNELAKIMLGHRFVTTYGREAENVRVVGKLPYKKVGRLLSNATVYLSTTKETFGVQLLEAMACGLPITGWDFGAIGDIVEHGRNGYLCKPGNYDGLRKGIEWCVKHRDTISKNNLEDVKDYEWKSVCEDIAKVYHVLEDPAPIEPDVTVVLTCYNRKWCIGRAIDSVLSQEFTGSVEIIVVDDASTDKSVEIIKSYGDKVKLIKLKNNSGAAMARNVGIQAAKSSVIASLDSDDEYLPTHLSRLVPVVRSRRDVGIAYGQLIVRNPKGNSNVAHWTRQYNIIQQLGKENHIPSASVFKKEAWRKARGYSTRWIRGEDSRFWLDITTVGYNAVYVGEPVYVCNIHKDSLTLTNELPDWTGDLPWSMNYSMVPMAAPANGFPKRSFPVYEYDQPWVSVIIPVAPWHDKVVWRAIESVWKQSSKKWECIVVNNSGKELIVPQTGDRLEDAFPFVTIIEADTEIGPGAARNIGVKHSKGGLLTFLDADDIMLQDYIQMTVQAWNDNRECYVYTDWFGDDGKQRQAQDFDPLVLLREAIHPVTILVPRAWHDDVGGFDEELEGWEDWDYVLRLAKASHGGHHLDEALVVYDYTTGQRREDSYTKRDSLLSVIRDRYRRTDMARCRSCSNKRRNPGVRTPRAIPPTIGRSAVIERRSGKMSSMVKVRDASGNLGRHGVVGASTRIKYGRKKHGDVFEMHTDDYRAQPHIYPIIQQHVKPVENIIPQIPEIPVVEPIIEDKVVEEVQPDVIDKILTAVIDAPIVAEKVIPVVATDDEFELDIALLPLDAIKRLELDSETAYNALEEEVEGRNRKGVVGYLRRTAKPYMDEFEISFEDIVG